MRKSTRLEFNLYEYLDFAQFLRDWVNLGKKHIPGFSFKYIADNAGFNSKSYIQNVMKGTSTFSEDAVLRMANIMELGAIELKYFKLIVDFKQAKTLGRKKELWAKIHARRKGRIPEDIHQREEAEFAYLSHWYLPVMKELIIQYPFDGNYAKLGRRFLPHITASEAKFALSTLLELGFLHQDGDSYFDTKPNITIESQLKSLAIRNFQKEHALIGADAIENIRKENRDISTITMGISTKSVPKIKQLISQFQKDIVDAVNEHGEPELVYALNVQLFPVTKTEEQG
jgi:uncharacterized protein (TIGR02147 family)